MDASNKTMMKPYNLNFAIRSIRIRNSIKLANPMAGIYIHIPFCKQACTYCNFHFSTNLDLQNDFTAALLKEISLRKSYIKEEIVETIYFGGGTPSLLPPQTIYQILESVSSYFRIDQNPEITLETNPDDIDMSHLDNWK